MPVKPSQTVNSTGRILLLEHGPSQVAKNHYIARYLLQSLEKKGIEIIRCSNPDDLPAADALFVHVDLSVLPLDYRGLGGKFEASVNADLVDIRKRTLGLNQVMPGDGYEGPVIVKSNLNSAGWAERKTTVPRDSMALNALRLRRRWRVLRNKLTARFVGLPRAPDMLSKSDYLILPAATKVPASWFANQELVIERFTPEMHEGQYVLREWYFLGDAEFVRAETADYPIITSGLYRPELVRPIPDNLRRLRKAWNIDYGKIDFVMKDGEAVVFDVNKTPSLTGVPKAEATWNLINALSSGLLTTLTAQRGPVCGTAGQA